LDQLAFRLSVNDFALCILRSAFKWLALPFPDSSFFVMHSAFGCWLPVGEFVAHLGVNSDRSYNWITGQKMAAHKLGLWKPATSEFDQWTEAGQAARDVAESAPGTAGKQKSAGHRIPLQ